MSHFSKNISLAPDASIDLHMHTTYSDGRWPAEKLIDYLVEEKFDLVAITDHDKVETVSKIQALAEEKGLHILSGVEMSTEWNGMMGDLLCYGFDPLDNDLIPITQSITKRQITNAYEVNDNLRSKGYEFPRQHEIFAARDGKIQYAYENAVLLREHGYVKTWNEAMQLVREAGFKPIRVDMNETVEAAHRSGAVCLIAHPGRRESGFTFYDTDLLDRLRADVPIDGIELYHPTHSQQSIESYREYIQKHKLLYSTGSDSHCIPSRMPIKYQAKISHQLLERVGIRVG